MTSDVRRGSLRPYRSEAAPHKAAPKRKPMKKAELASSFIQYLPQMSPRSLTTDSLLAVHTQLLGSNWQNALLGDSSLKASAHFWSAMSVHRHMCSSTGSLPCRIEQNSDDCMNHRNTVMAPKSQPRVLKTLHGNQQKRSGNALCGIQGEHVARRLAPQRSCCHRSYKRTGRTRMLNGRVCKPHRHQGAGAQQRSCLTLHLRAIFKAKTAIKS